MVTLRDTCSPFFIAAIIIISTIAVISSTTLAPKVYGQSTTSPCLPNQFRNEDGNCEPIPLCGPNQLRDTLGNCVERFSPYYNPCRDNYFRDENHVCRPTQVTLPRCPPNPDPAGPRVYERDANGRCIIVDISIPLPSCPSGQERNTAEQCVNRFVFQPCPDDQERNAELRCVPEREIDLTTLLGNFSSLSGQTAIQHIRPPVDLSPEDRISTSLKAAGSTGGQQGIREAEMRQGSEQSDESLLCPEGYRYIDGECRPIALPPLNTSQSQAQLQGQGITPWFPPAFNPTGGPLCPEGYRYIDGECRPIALPPLSQGQGITPWFPPQRELEQQTMPGNLPELPWFPSQQQEETIPGRPPLELLRELEVEDLQPTITLSPDNRITTSLQAASSTDGQQLEVITPTPQTELECVGENCPSSQTSQQGTNITEEEPKDSEEKGEVEEAEQEVIEDEVAEDE